MAAVSAGQRRRGRARADRPGVRVTHTRRLEARDCVGQQVARSVLELGESGTSAGQLVAVRVEPLHGIPDTAVRSSRLEGAGPGEQQREASGVIDGLLLQYM